MNNITQKANKYIQENFDNFLNYTMDVVKRKMLEGFLLECSPKRYHIDSYMIPKDLETQATIFEKQFGIFLSNKYKNKSKEKIRILLSTRLVIDYNPNVTDILISVGKNSEFKSLIDYLYDMEKRIHKLETPPKPIFVPMIREKRKRKKTQFFGQ